MELIKCAGGGESLVTTAYFLLGRIPRISWAPGDSRISPLQHSSMTSCPKWEELARDGCCGVFFFCCSCRSAYLHALSKLENRAYSNRSWLYFFVLLERGFCMAPSGIREEYLFPNDSVSVLQVAHSAGIHK